MKERRIDRKMFIRKIKILLYKKITQKNNLMLLGDFIMTLGNKNRSTGSKGFCESQEELMILITEFDLEDLWRYHNPSRIDRTYTSTNVRVGVKTDHEINTFSYHFQTIVIKREPTTFKRGKGHWILNCGLLQDKEYIQHIKRLWENWQTQQNDFRSISEWWEEGRQHIKAFTKLFTRADTTAQQQKKCSLKRRLRNIYTKIDANPHLQNLAYKLKNELKQIEMKKAQGAKICAKMTWELEGKKRNKYFFQKLEKKNADQAILSLKSKQNGKRLKNKLEILTEVKTFYEKLYRQKKNIQKQIEINHRPSMIGRNDQDQSIKKFNFNLERCGPKDSNTKCYQETPNHNKLRMQSTLISRVKKKNSPENRHEREQEKTVAEIEKTKSFEIIITR